MMEIETWKKIAYKVQRLKIKDCYGPTFCENLEKLKRLLSDLDISLDEGYRNPRREQDIGLSSLLQSIYEIKVDSNHKKACFYEQIYQLSELGVQYIEFCPAEFYEEIHSLKKVHDEGQDRTTIEKYYTDGEFQITEEKIKRKYELGYYYTVRNLTNANYILCTTLSKSSETKITWVELSQASLKNFNGVFPSKEEHMSFNFPELEVAEQSLIWGEEPRVKEKFETFDLEEASYQKRLTRTQAGEYYYKESRT